MLKKICPILAFLLVLVSFAFAEPVSFIDDLTGNITLPYDSSDPASCSYTCIWAYPVLDGNDEFALAVNSFYQKKAEDAIVFDIPILAECMIGCEYDTLCETTYTVTCNNDSYLSFLFTQKEISSEYESIRYYGHTFSRMEIKPDSTVALPYLLGILSNGNNDTWLQDRQTDKADSIVRELVWEQLINGESSSLYDWVTEEYFQEVFYPEEDFYLNENGNPVFFVLPGEIASEESGLLTFEIDLEDIMDEM